MTGKKPRPKTGEPRKTRQPLNIDRLPSSVHDAILQLRNTHGKTWAEIEALSDCKAAEGKCFIPWLDLPISVLELFPDMRLSHTTLHRWFDVRVEQVSRDVMARAKQAQVVARAFAKAGVAGDKEAVVNAARDTLMGILAEDSSDDGRAGAAKGLLKLAEVMQKARTNDIRERKVEVEEQTLQIKLDEIRRKAAEIVKAAEGDPQTGAPAITREEMLVRVKDLYGVA